MAQKRLGIDATDLFARAIVAAGLPEPVREHQFCPGRRFAFDLAWLHQQVALEREGGTWIGGRHTSGKGYESDCVKYSLAAILGWRVIRVTASMIQDGRALALIEAALTGLDVEDVAKRV